MLNHNKAGLIEACIAMEIFLNCSPDLKAAGPHGISGYFWKISMSACLFVYSLHQMCQHDRKPGIKVSKLKPHASRAKFRIV